MEKSSPLLNFITIGRLSRDFIITLAGRAYIDIPGGSLLYSAVGAGVWESGIGLVARVSEDYPQGWLEQVSRFGFDIRGIHFLKETFDMRSFTAYMDSDTSMHENPISHFARLGLSFPKSLLGFTSPAPAVDNRLVPTLMTIRQNDIPPDYLDATAVHLCSLDYLSHTLLPPLLRQGQVNTLTLELGEGYMTPVFWEQIPTVVKGIDAVLTSEERLRNLFQGRSIDPWEMAEAIAGFGCDIVVIKRGSKGQYLYEHASRTKWQIPFYPSTVVDPTGAADAFCGGFLAGYQATYNPLEGALQGNISASLVAEGTGPFYALDALPGLARSRLEALRYMIRKV